MDLFNTIENKVRFYGKKIDLMWKKHKVILRICLRGFAFYTFLLSVLLCAVLSLPISDGILNVLFEAIRNICYSYIAGYIFYIISDVYPKTLNKIIEIKDVITYEICILHNANSVLDTTVKFSRSPNNETDRIKKFIVNSSKINPYISDVKLIELNDVFLQHLFFMQNECQNPFNMLLKYKAHLLEHEEVRILLELKDFIFLNDFYNKKSMYLLGFELECYDYISNIHKLEELIKEQMKSYVYNPCDYERLEKNLKSQMDLSVRYNKAIMSDPYKKTYILERILKEGSFEDNYPEKALDWDYDDARNQPYKPSDFLSGSNKLVYWKCHVCGYKSITPKTIISHAKAKFPCEKCAIKGISNQRYGEEPITVTNPELLKEWDYDKNVQDGIFPEKVTNHDSKTLVNWVCKRGHHWKRSISYRLHSTSGKCPICQREMQTSFPEQALYFYFNEQVKCINGYRLKNNSHIDIFIPSKNVGIEYDGPKHKTPIQKARDERKNIFLQKMGVKLYRVIESEKFSVEEDTIYVIYDKNYRYLNYAIKKLCSLIGIPYVSIDVERNKTAIMGSYLTREKENSIASLYPYLLAEWDYEKNENIAPECVSRGSGLKLYWKCKKGHSWSAPPSNRTKGHGCPYCAGVKLLSGFNDLATLYPNLLDEWDYLKNENIGVTPEGIAAGNNKQKVFWICKNKPEHKWAATVAGRVSGTGCPYCADEQRKVSKRKTYVRKNGSFAQKYPGLLEDWFYEKNDALHIFPDKIPSHYSEVVWWKCHVCGHLWTATPDHRANGRGCSNCGKENHSHIMREVLLARYGSLAQNNPRVAAFWDYSSNAKTPDYITSKCHDKIKWKCPKCNYQWVKRVYKMTQYPCCPNCKYSLNEEKRPIVQFDLELNEIAKYDSPKEAAIATGIGRQYILATARHDSKSTHGFVFRYEDDVTDIKEFKPTHQPTPKSVLQYTKDGKFVKEWPCIRAAEIECSIANGKISAVCKGQRKVAGGYIWKYKESK